MISEVRISEADLEDCVTFADRVAQDARQFGSGEIRTSVQQSADMIVGKLGEVALQNFLERDFETYIALDFAYYEAGDDGLDIALVYAAGQWYRPDFRFDCKGNTGAARWLLIEKRRIAEADAYAMVRLKGCPSIPKLRNGATFESWDRVAEICGFAYAYDFFEVGTRRPFFEYRAGQRLLADSCIPDERPETKEGLERAVRSSNPKHIGPRLDAASNIGLPVKWLRRSKVDWLVLLDRIRGSLREPSPTLLTKYPLDHTDRIRNR